MILLDTNIVSEFMRPSPAAEVIGWLDAQPRHQLHICAPVLFELEYGLRRLASGRRREELVDSLGRFLAAWLDENIILPFDTAAARRAAAFLAQRSAAGRPLGMMDAQVAGIAATHDATLATHDSRDFAGLALRLVDPWRA